jgi:predicted flavoprotein YhiN
LGFRVTTDNFVVESKYVLVATGGVSYPKTGSVGDGQEWAQKLGHAVMPYRPGLVGFEVDPKVLKGRIGKIYERVVVDVMSGGRQVGETRGVFEIEKWGVGGTALTDVSRIVARQKLEDYSLVVHVQDGKSEEIRPIKPRPIKEAMVTVGGVGLGDVDGRTMESRKCGGLYFAGEVLDVDGPTGGYNLQAAFSTARLAVGAIGKRCGKRGFKPQEGARKKPPAKRRR